MIKDNQGEMWAPTSSVRLEPDLAERLRVAAFTQRSKKQPILRDGIMKLLERENTRPAAAVRKRWAALVADQPQHTPMREAVRITPDQDEALRKFCYDYRLHKQTVIRQALIEHLDQLDGAGKRKR